jgi:putative ABC transport system permease protein
VHFQVVGLVKSELPGQEGDRDDSTLTIPFSSFQAAFNTGDQVGWFGIRARADADSDRVEEAVRQVLKARHRAHPDDRQAIGSFNLGEKHQRVANLFRGIRLFVWFVCVATLLAGALGVSNIMLISVKERTREFGVRKALGASPGSIVRLVLQEASVLTALAGYLGIVAGVLALELVPTVMAGAGGSSSGAMGAPGIDLSAALVTVLVLAISGMLAGLAPARHAARIHPVVALRSE